MVKALRETSPSPTAIFVAGHYLTEWIVKVLKGKEVRIPQDISVVRMEDCHDESLEDAGIILLHQDSYKMGSGGMEIFVKLLTEEMKKPVHHFLDMRLIERSSCRAVKTGQNKTQTRRKYNEVVKK